MNFEEYVKESIEHVVKIREKLKETFGNIDRDLELILVKAAVEPWGLVKAPRQPQAASGESGNRTAGHDEEHPLTEKQSAIIVKHLSGSKGAMIMSMIGETGKPLEKLSSREASRIIDMIFNGINGGRSDDAGVRELDGRGDEMVRKDRA